MKFYLTISFLKNINEKANLGEPESALVRESSFFIDLEVKTLDSLSRGPVSKPLGRSKVDSAFHPSDVDKMSARNSRGLVIKSKLSPLGCSVH